MKYFVTKTTTGKLEYKKYKCIDGWSTDPKECWQFSKAGAQNIANRLNEQHEYGSQSYPKKIHFNTMEAARVLGTDYNPRYGFSR